MSDVQTSPCPTRHLAGGGRMKNRIEYSIPQAAMGAPRQTRADAWQKRPVVMRYRAWQDLLQLMINPIPPAETVERLEVIAYYAPPKSWSKKRRAAAIGTRKRSVPDPDNIWKAVADALWKNDAALGRCECDRFYGLEDMTVITIEIMKEVM